jgi:pyruvate carboxylase subunit B
MWQALRGTEYTLEINEEKILEVEKMFIDQMEKYYLPTEAVMVNPIIPFSPMPGGALTANTQMMRDNDSLDLFSKVIENMREVVAKGGYGTSVTPVSQFYFQQAFTNTVQEKWSKISESYGKMILGYFGKTPTAPDPEIVKIASKQLSLKPTKEDVHDLNDNNPNMGIDYNKKLLEDKNIESTDENIFISATCGAKGIAFLEGNGELGIRYKDDNIEKTTNSNNNPSSDDITRVTVNGKDYEVIIHSN